MDEPNTDFAPDEGLTPCEIPGCHTRVLGDPRCLQHGGNPRLECSTDEWGGTTWTFSVGDTE